MKVCLFLSKFNLKKIQSFQAQVMKNEIFGDNQLNGQIFGHMEKFHYGIEESTMFNTIINSIYFYGKFYLETYNSPFYCYYLFQIFLPYITDNFFLDFSLFVFFKLSFLQISLFGFDHHDDLFFVSLEF